MSGMPAGAINWYVCPVCDGLTVTVHRDEGITPSRIDCRADGKVGGCEGQAASAWYPNTPLPERRRYAVWAWFRPDIRELMASETPPDQATIRYLEGGGLLLQPVVLTDELKRALAVERMLQVKAPRKLGPLPNPGKDYPAPVPFRRRLLN